jgi:Na+/H+-dicarboxylate symporter
MLGTSSSSRLLPRMMEDGKPGAKKVYRGPGDSDWLLLQLDGTSIYLTMAAVFIMGDNTLMTLTQELTLASRCCC